MKIETKVFTVAVQFGYSHKEMVELLQQDYEDDLSVERQDERFESILEEYEFEDLEARITGMLQKEFSQHAVVVRMVQIKTVL
jgi:hypothetical protein